MIPSVYIFLQIFLICNEFFLFYHFLFTINKKTV